jgi:hypothetical protein
MIAQVMGLIGPVWQDLKAKKLWPVALVLLLAIIAVPLVLTTSSSAPSGASGTSQSASLPASGLPAVSQKSVSGGAGLNGSAHNPFAPQPGTGGATTTTAATSGGTPSSSSSSTTGGSSTNPATGGGGSTGQPSTGGSSGTTTTPSGPPPKIPTPKPRPTTPSLKPTQSYAVSLAITNPQGGINTIGSLQRLSLLPSQHQPLLVELGVLKGGSRVLFAVQQGTFVSGPGTCIPGPIDCQIVSLGQGQTEAVGIHSTTGSVREALFAVTAINTPGHGSASAAMRARQSESAAGRSVLNHSSLSALSLFRYEANLGALVDLRNLIVGGS